MQDPLMQGPDWRAFDSVDTAFEAAGFVMAQNLALTVSRYLLPVILLIGVVVVIYQAVTKQDLKRALFYFFYILVMHFLLEPAAVSRVKGLEVQAPRMLVWLNGAADFIVNRAEMFKSWEEVFRFQRLTQTLAEARITEPALKEDLKFFLDYCYVPALARGKTDSVYTLNPFLHYYLDESRVWKEFSWVHYEGYREINVDLEDGTTVNCKEFAESFQRKLGEHIHKTHFEPIHEIAKAYNVDLTRTALMYAERVLYNECFGGTPADSIEKKFTRYVSSPESFGEKVLEKGLAGQREGGWQYVGTSVTNGWEMAKESVAYGFSWLTKEFSPIYARYMVVMMAPVFYGLVFMMLAACFPLVAVFAILPFKWPVILNFAKLFGSVKLWPLFWATIGKIESSVMAGEVTELFTTHEVSASSVALGAAAMYLVVPALSYMVVSLVTNVVAAPFPQVQAAGAPAGFQAMRDAGGVLQKVGQAMEGEAAKAGAASKLPVGLRGGK